MKINWDSLCLALSFFLLTAVIFYCLPSKDDKICQHELAMAKLGYCQQVDQCGVKTWAKCEEVR